MKKIRYGRLFAALGFIGLNTWLLFSAHVRLASGIVDTILVLLGTAWILHATKDKLQ